MIFVETILKILDNTNAILCKCIKTLKKNPRIGATIANTIIVTIHKVKTLNYKRLQKKKKIKIQRKSIHRGLIVRLNCKLKRFDGNFIRFFENSIILIDTYHAPLGSRIIGPLLNEIRFKKYSKIVLLAGLLF
jgi:large subunit ribosomal protein L14